MLTNRIHIFVEIFQKKKKTFKVIQIQQNSVQKEKKSLETTP